MCGFSTAAFNHVLLIDLSLAVTSYQGSAKFSAALSPGPNWSLPEANWLDCSDMSKSISQLNGAGRWRAVIAATAAACRLWPCGETELEMSPLNSLLPWKFYSWLEIYQWVSVCVFVVCTFNCLPCSEGVHRFPRPEAAGWNEWQLFWVAGDPAANPPKDSSRAAGDGQLHGWICQEIGPEHTALCVRDDYRMLP